MNFADYFMQLKTGYRLWISRKLYFAHSLNMNQTDFIGKIKATNQQTYLFILTTTEFGAFSSVTLNTFEEY